MSINAALLIYCYTDEVPRLRFIFLLSTVTFALSPFRLASPSPPHYFYIISNYVLGTRPRFEPFPP